MVVLIPQRAHQRDKMQSSVPPRSCLVLREELNERRVRNAQYRILAALICPGRSAFPAEIKYTRPTFKKADDLLGGNLQPLRDFRRRKVFRQCWEACR